MSTQAYPPISAWRSGVTPLPNSETFQIGGAPYLLAAGSSGSIAFRHQPGWAEAIPWFTFGTSVSDPATGWPISLQIAGSWVVTNSAISMNAVQLGGSPTPATSLSWVAFGYQIASYISPASLIATTLAAFAANSGWCTPLPSTWGTSTFAGWGAAMALAENFAAQLFAYAGTPDPTTTSAFLAAYANSAASQAYDQAASYWPFAA